MQSKQEEIDELKRIVNDVFLVDIEIQSSVRRVVDARKVYSKILRDSGCSYELIGETINKDHASIIHYVKTVEHLLFYDKNLRDKYVACKNIFIKKRKSISEQIKKDVDIYVTVVRLTNELQEALDIRDKLLNEFFDYIKDYEERAGRLPNSHECKHHILQLFNK
jgi:hypothetical protein